MEKQTENSKIPYRDNAHMMSVAWDLIYLVSCAVKGELPDQSRCTKMDDQAVYQMACSHMLSAAAAYALKKCRPLSAEWQEARGYALRNHILFDLERAKVLHLLEKNGIRYLPLKGAVLKQLYPHPAMREMSDNDILYDFTHADKVRSLMEGLGYTCKKFLHTDQGHDIYFKPPTISFEMHRTLMNRYTFPVLFDYYQAKDDLWQKDADNRYGYHMTNEDFYLFLIGHMYKHYVHAGTGIRSLLDIYIYCRSYPELADSAAVQAELKKMELSNYERITRSLAIKIFSGEKLSNEEEKELLCYVESNVYGTEQKRLRRELNHDAGTAAKLRYLRRRFIPPRDSLQQSYPAVYRHRILYPLVVLYRPIKGMFKHPVKLKKEIQNLFRYQQDPDQSEK